jgi:glucose-6-phosphate dehydrogenase assembly protein OpcA
VNATKEAPIEAGFPVEIGRIDKELGQLWDEVGDTKTRASLVNLAIFTEDANSVAANTDLISKIASQYACRALLIFANSAAAQPSAKAWINAHCHLAGKGERQICSEQITFQLDGEMVSALPNIVFSHLDSDLPLYFWWQGEFREPLDEKLWVWVDRLLYDSAEWNNPAEQFQLVRTIRTLTEARTILCDLNWTRLIGSRFALAQMFDHSCALARVGKVGKVSISCANHTASLLLLGWLAAQLDWKLQPTKDFFLSGAGKRIDFETQTRPGPILTRCAFDCEDATLEIWREPNSEYFQARIGCEGTSDAVMLVPAGRSELADILVTELSRGGNHPLYRRSLAAIDALF